MLRTLLLILVTGYAVHQHLAFQEQEALTSEAFLCFDAQNLVTLDEDWRYCETVAVTRRKL